jgi:hypothetical protein
MKIMQTINLVADWTSRNFLMMLLVVFALFIAGMMWRSLI